MKKALLLSALLLSLVTLVKAQKKWELNFFAKVDTMSTHRRGDTAVMKTYIVLNIGAVNVGTSTGGHDSFPGGKFGFHYYISTKADWPAKGITYSDTLDLGGIAYLSGATVAKRLYVDPLHFKGDQENIVIIWPNGGKAYNKPDSIDSGKHYAYPLYIIGKNNGVNNFNTLNNFSIYPNPARENLNIRLNHAGNGFIKITDLSGKAVAMKNFETSMGTEITLPLNEGAGLPNGIYFVAVETSLYKEVTKIIVSR